MPSPSICLLHAGVSCAAFLGFGRLHTHSPLPVAWAALSVSGRASGIPCSFHGCGVCAHVPPAIAGPHAFDMCLLCAYFAASCAVAAFLALLCGLAEAAAFGTAAVRRRHKASAIHSSSSLTARRQDGAGRRNGASDGRKGCLLLYSPRHLYHLHAPGRVSSRLARIHLAWRFGTYKVLRAAAACGSVPAAPMTATALRFDQTWFYLEHKRCGATLLAAFSRAASCLPLLPPFA